MKKFLPITLITAGVAAIAGVIVYKTVCEKNEECKITKLVKDLKSKKPTCTCDCKSKVIEVTEDEVVAEDATAETPEEEVETSETKDPETVTEE